MLGFASGYKQLGTAVINVSEHRIRGYCSHDVYFMLKSHFFATNISFPNYLQI